jgi:hexosaminidase
MMDDDKWINAIIPKPVSMEMGTGFFNITSRTELVVPQENDGLLRIANYLAESLSPATGYPFDMAVRTETAGVGNIHLVLEEGMAELGREGYGLSVRQEGVFITALQPAGIFHGVQTLRQLFDPYIESREFVNRLWELPLVEISDYPRFGWRGVMLDVARHFFPVGDVKRFIDLMACYKLNVLHLHLTDDQGWRIEIKSWPDLTTIGSSTSVGGGAGGFYTQKEFKEIVDYARNRCVTVVPEIDLPGHTNAALASYPELNRDGQAPDLYTGMGVGFSSLRIDNDVTHRFIADVIGELAAITPGPYIHVGGDEARATSLEDYQKFICGIQDVVRGTGKQMVGWQEILHCTDLLPGTVVQFWNHLMGDLAFPPGNRIVVSPANRVYLDMKYNEDCPLGLDWAGYLGVKDAYDWDPTTELQDVPEGQILGVEAPLWSETLETLADVEFMALPRLPGVAEIGWSKRKGRSWDEYKERLARHAVRWDLMGVNYYKSPSVPWLIA